MLRSLEQLRPDLGARVYLDPAAAVIGEVTLGDDCSVWPMTVIRGDVHHIRIGERSNIQDGAVLHVSHDSHYLPGGAPLIVGSEVTVGHKVILHGCTIGDCCLIGMGAIVMDRAVLEPQIILGAGSLVPTGKHLEGGALYLGSPVRRVRSLTDEEKDYLAYSAAHYVRLKDRYLAESAKST
ncbi:MAG: gamma carbonic anhydrase family protein [Chromatiales bacterium]|nr:gamma carbonic anhydrase family protein [Chromatiales bacterium]